MSLNFLPGYDFTYNEQVTSEKLRKWISGMNNTSSLSASEVGVLEANTGIDINTAVTWNSGVSVGALTFNRNTGFVDVTTKWGEVPVFGTQGGLFTARLRDDRTAAGDAFSYLFAGNNPLTIGVEPGLSPTLPAANYTLGTGYDCFGGNDVIGSCFGVNYTLNRGGKTFTRYPNAARHSVDGTYTADSCVSLAASIHSLYKIGGVDTLRYDFPIVNNLAAKAEVTALSCIASAVSLASSTYARYVYDYDLNLAIKCGTNNWCALQAMDAATNITVYYEAQLHTGGDCHSLVIDTTEKLFFYGDYDTDSTEGLFVYAYTGSNVSQIGRGVALVYPDEAESLTIDTAKKVITLGIDCDSKIVGYSYNTDGTLTNIGTVSQVPYGGRVLAQGFYDKASDFHVVTQGSYGMHFIRLTASTISIHHTFDQNITTLKGPFKAGDLYGAIVGNTEAGYIYFAAPYSAYSIVDVAYAPLTCIFGDLPAFYGDVVACPDDYVHTIKLLKSTGTQLTLLETIAGIPSLRWLSNGMFLYVEGRTTTTDIYESLGYSFGEAGSVSAVTGIRGEMSGNVWDMAITATAVTHPTSQRVHPNTQCFYETGSNLLSTGFLYPTLSTPSEGFSKGGSSF